MPNLKYVAFGILVGYLGLYVLELSQAKLSELKETENKD
jgi:hypothetical protein